MEIIHGKLGAVGSYDLQLTGGKLIAKQEIEVKSIILPFAEKLKKMIPGGIDDMVIDAAIKEYLEE